MHNKYILIGIIIGVIVGMLFTSAAVVLAGNLNPANPPESTSSYSLADIYERLTNGTTGTQATFTEPTNGPGSTMYDLNAVMAAAPAPDATNGAVAADVANGKTFWGLTSGEWGLQTGTGTIATYPAVVPKTGQITNYATGDDGDLGKGVTWPSPRFTDNGDGTVTDNLTGLIWLQNANCWGSSQDWNNGIALSNGLANGQCSLTDGSIAGDWRLPNAGELHSLIDFSQYSPALPNGHPFVGVMSAYYWTSTTRTNLTTDAWWVNLFDGGRHYSSKTTPSFIWPVRGGQ